MSAAPSPSSGPEFSRIVRLDAIGRIQWPAHVEADALEREALARRFGFAALDTLAADYSLTREGRAVIAAGSIEARLSQPCIATGEPVEEQVRDDFTIRFVPEEEEAAAGQGEELELDASECDTVPYRDGRIDMGEAIAETLALSVNPYPRSSGAETYLRAAGVLSEEQAGPFASLAALKEKSRKG